ncbi:ribonuclease HII, partial [Flavobacteriaceae bacterium]|nr:ribonuclease HII [Flavobacteriaceae bacterium]
MLSIQLTNFIEAGTDEAGRGCLAGPVTAAAVILPQDLNLPFLNDSKKLTEKQRNILRPQIENQAIAFSVAHVF